MTSDAPHTNFRHLDDFESNLFVIDSPVNNYWLGSTCQFALSKRKGQ